MIGSDSVDTRCDDPGEIAVVTPMTASKKRRSLVLPTDDPGNPEVEAAPAKRFFSHKDILEAVGLVGSDTF